MKKHVTTLCLLTGILTSTFSFSQDTITASCKSILSLYLKSKSWQERVPYVLLPTESSPRMENYYRDVDLSSGKSLFDATFDSTAKKEKHNTDYYSINYKKFRGKNGFGADLFEYGTFYFKKTSEGFMYKQFLLFKKYFNLLHLILHQLNCSFS